MKKQLYNLLKLAISVGLLVLLFRVFDFQESWRALKGIRLGYLAVAWVLFQATMVIRAFRWRYLLDALEVHVPLHRLIYLYYVGVFFNTFLPSGFGGDAVKMYELARYSHRAAESVSTVFVDRLAGLVVLFVLGLAALPFAYAALPTEVVALLLAASVGGLLATWVLFQKRVIDRLIGVVPGALGRKLLGFYQSLHACGTRALWQALRVSVLFNLVLFTMNYVLALALDVRLPFIYFAAFMPILSLSMMLPSVGALGTREGAYVLMFGPAGVAEPVAIAMSLAFYVVNVLTGLVGIVLYLGSALAGLGQKEGITTKAQRTQRPE
ncbi:MAG: lysylphosphatidylglycerol synthase transmembrane domain-containing protein [Chloroflexota bacterium]